MTRPDTYFINGRVFYRFIVEFSADGPACALVYATNWRCAAQLALTFVQEPAL